MHGLHGAVSSSCTGLHQHHAPLLALPCALANAWPLLAMLDMMSMRTSARSMRGSAEGSQRMQPQPPLPHAFLKDPYLLTAIIRSPSGDEGLCAQGGAMGEAMAHTAVDPVHNMPCHHHLAGGWAQGDLFVFCGG